MTSRFTTRRAKAVPLSQARAEARAKVMLAIGQTHVALAEALQVSPLVIGKMERHTDIYIATLRQHVEAMGGQLQVIVSFPDGAVKLSNFIDLDNDGLPADEPRVALNGQPGSDQTPALGRALALPVHRPPPSGH
jgi:hypothetical protein